MLNTSKNHTFLVVHEDRRTAIGALKVHLSRGIKKRWSIFYCTIREVQGPVWPRAARQIIVRSPRSIAQSVKSENIFFYFEGSR